MNKTSSYNMVVGPKIIKFDIEDPIFWGDQQQIESKTCELCSKKSVKFCGFCSKKYCKKCIYKKKNLKRICKICDRKFMMMDTYVDY
jgi:hypothetical protein